MIDGRVDVDVGVIAGFAAGDFLLVLPPHVLLVVRQSHIEIKGFVPLRKSQANEGVLAMAVLDLKHEVTRRVQHGLDGALALAGVDEAGGEQIAGVRILESDLAPVLAGDDPEPTRPDLVGLEPLAALVATRGGPGRDFVDGDFTDYQEGVLERLLLLERHRFGRLRACITIILFQYLQGCVPNLFCLVMFSRVRD